MAGISNWFKRLVDFVREFDRGMSVMRYPSKAGSPGAGASARRPEVRVSSSGGETSVNISLRGVSPGDVDLSLSQRRTLTVSGILRPEEVSGAQDLEGLRTFREEVVLPAGVGPEGARAKVAEGCIEITFDGTAPEETRRIPLQDLSH